MTSPRVSILVPVYNRVGMINECIDSALSQDYPDLEVVVSDNCSTDGTWELCCQSYQDNPKVKLIRNERNLGPVPNWLAAAQAASGQYAKILFSDDLLLDGCISSLVANLEVDVGFVYSACLIGACVEFSSLVYISRSVPKGSILRLPSPKGLIRYALSEYARIPFSPGAALFRTSDVISSLSRSIENPTSAESLSTGAGPDVQIFLDALVSYPYFVHLNQPLCFFRAHPGSFSVGEQRAKVREGYKSALAMFFRDKFFGYRFLYIFSRIRPFFLFARRAIVTLLGAVQSN